MFPRFGVTTQTALGGSDHRQSGFNNYGLAASTTAGFGFASFLLGAGTDGNVYQNWKNVASQSFYQAFFVQEDWRVTKKLTLNIGVRFDFDTPRTERYNRMSWFDPSLTSPLAARVPAFPNLKGGLRFAGVDGNGGSKYTGDWNNLAPRLGFAYQINEKTAIRGALALLFGPSTRSAQGTAGTYSFRVETPWVASLNGITPVNLLSNPFPAGFRPVPGSSQGALTAIGSNLDAPLSNTNTPYTFQYNLTIQRQLPGAILLEMAYVGNRGRQLSRGGVRGAGVVANTQASRAQLLRPYPQFGAIYPLFSQGATSNYDSLQVTFSKRYAKGIAFEGSYVWAKAIDEGASYQDSYNARASRSVSSIHVPQRLVFSVVYELPLGRGRQFGKGMFRWMELFAGGWQLNGIWTAQSGSTLGIGATNQAGPFTEAIRANNNRTRAAQGSYAHKGLDRWFDTSVFSQPAPFTLGNMGQLVANLRGHHINNLDASIFKQFAITEKLRLQFRAESFNALNRVRFGNPTTTVTAAANFGRITTQSNSPKQMQFGLMLIW